jgi:hypothetical protein
MTKNMEKGYSDGQMADTIKVNGKKTTSMVKAYTIKMKST